MRLFWIILGLTACTSVASAQSVHERIARDELAIVDESDPDMVVAIRKGRETLPQFLKIARAPKPSMSNFSVKVAIRAGGEYEYMWISQFKDDNGVFSGSVNNIPRWATHLKEGDVFSFLADQIVDWLYIEDRKMKGNFTICAILKKEPKADADRVKKQYGLSCD